MIATVVVQAALHIVILVIVVAGCLLILIAYFLYKMLAAKAQLDSDYKTRPPPTLTKPAQVVYHCDVTIGRQPTRPLPNADVTFTIVHGHATVDGAASKTVKTDANGDATVTLAPVSTGGEELRLHVEAGSKAGDETPIQFEVVKTP